MKKSLACRLQQSEEPPQLKVLTQASKWIPRVAALAGVLGSSTLAYAQGCAMCYTSAAASKAGAVHALRSGILILLLPALVMFAGIFVVIYRSRNRFSGVVDWTPEQDRELRELLVRMDGIERADPRIGFLPSVDRTQFPVTSHPGITDDRQRITDGLGCRNGK